MKVGEEAREDFRKRAETAPKIMAGNVDMMISLQRLHDENDWMPATKQRLLDAITAFENLSNAMADEMDFLFTMSENEKEIN